ncbi:MAG: ribosome small subunit-dependent GTPase A [Muribaculaceae bacterium]|nr:ribosome small subunit-dependent GTPase A [Muribaculaceae bacterium]
MKGTVIKNTGSMYVVEGPDRALYNCKIKGNFRIKGIRTTNPVAIGDSVRFEPPKGGNSDTPLYFITEIEPRKNYIIRRASNLSKESHIIAANLDQSMLVISLKNPETSLTFVDRFLATAEAYNIPTQIIINKIDNLDNEDIELANAIKTMYNQIGYQVILSSAKNGDGIDAIREILVGKITLFSGNSGVGKTSLINKLIPDLNLRTADISATHHTGMHTTTFSEMHFLPSGNGCIIDTPGVKGFGTIDFDIAEVAHYFPEIFETSHECKYNNCTHTHEPGCAVRQAVENSYISQSRYASYLSILEDSESGKYRNPF